MKKFLSLFIALILVVSAMSMSAVVAFAAEGDSADDTVAATGIKLEPASKTVYFGEGLTEDVKFTIEAKLTPDGAEGKVTFSMAEPVEGITLDAETGEVTVSKDIAAAGEYTITATLEGSGEGDDAKVISEEFKLKIRAELTVDETALQAAMQEHSKSNLERNFAMSDKFQLNNDWMKVESGEGENKKVSAQNVRDVFNGIDYYIDGEKDGENNDLYDKDHKYDVVSVEYLTPSGDPKVESDWRSIALTSTFSMRTEGWWQFRYVVKDVDGEVIARTAPMVRNAVDTQSPVIKLSTSLESKQREGLKVNESYSISTYLDITDDRSPSDTTTSYVVEKKIDGKWVEVYNSKDKEIKDEYKDFILDGGTIKPIESDVIQAENDADRYIYRVIYSVKDGAGHFGVAASGDAAEAHPTLNLFVNPADAQDENKATDAWKIVLYIVAGLAAVGIIVLLCVKPKEAPADGRVAPSKSDDKAENAEAEEKEQDDND